MKASLVVDYHLNNKIFDLGDKNVNRDDYAYSLWLLREGLAKVNVDLSTCDINKSIDSDLVMYFDLPKKPVIEGKFRVLFLFESEVIKPDGWDLAQHKYFNRVYTWNDDLVDGKKYFKFNYSHLFPKEYEKERFDEKTFNENKLCTLISANKIVEHELELYSERVKTIRWFEKYAPEDFDLYGIGWDEFASNSRYVKFLIRKIPLLNRLLHREYSSYGGSVISKKSTMKGYRFAICYENARSLPGYITEKIFDCFFSGCVPVYWGPDNIHEYIPNDCYVDRRDFSSNKEMYDFLKNISWEQYLSYQEAIQRYVMTDGKQTNFNAEVFVKNIIEELHSVGVLEVVE